MEQDVADLKEVETSLGEPPKSYICDKCLKQVQYIHKNRHLQKCEDLRRYNQDEQKSTPDLERNENVYLCTFPNCNRVIDKGDRCNFAHSQHDLVEYAPSSLEISKTIPQKKVYCIPTNTSLPVIDRPVNNPCVHFLNKKCTNDSCKFDHVSYCLKFYNYGLCNDTECREFHPQELTKLVQNGVKTGEGFYYRWKNLYRAQICRAKYKENCTQNACVRFHLHLHR